MSQIMLKIQAESLSLYWLGVGKCYSMTHFKCDLYAYRAYLGVYVTFRVHLVAVHSQYGATRRSHTFYKGFGRRYLVFISRHEADSLSM